MNTERPTVAELEALLKSDDDTPITINPDGSIGVKPELQLTEREAMLAESNIYCRILTLLGCEEEGDPVEEIKSLQNSWMNINAKYIAAVEALTQAQEIAMALQRNLGEAEKTNAMLADNWANTEKLLAKRIPEGYALVPVTPTQAMLDAGGMMFPGSDPSYCNAGAQDVWGEMLTASRPYP